MFWRTANIVAVAWLAGAAGARGLEFMAGADISALPVLEGNNAVYRANGVAGDVVEMFSDRGVNWFRLRLFVDPSQSSDPFVKNDLDYTLALAQRVKAVGGKLLLDFHYSDSWADPGKQTKPAAWANLNFTNLTTRVHDYTRDAVAAFKAAGVLPEMVQIGNEISNGMLWQDGYVWTGGSHSTGFNRLASLLTAGINGAKAGAGPGDEPLVMIHHDKGADWNTSRFFFDQLRDRSVDFDVIGYSYYPKFHYNPNTGAGGIDALRSTLANTADRYGKPVVLVETGFASRGQQFEPTYEFPVSVAGQRQFLEAVIEAVQDVPHDLGRGVFWWYPEARPSSGLPVWEGGRYGWFDANGNLLPTIEALAGLNPPPTPGDYNGDGTVDGDDLAAWTAQLWQTGAGLPADGDGNGLVDGADFLLWQRSLSGAAAQATPEPAGSALLPAFCAAAAMLRRRR